MVMADVDGTCYVLEFKVWSLVISEHCCHPAFVDWCIFLIMHENTNQVVQEDKRVIIPNNINFLRCGFVTRMWYFCHHSVYRFLKFDLWRITASFMKMDIDIIVFECPKKNQNMCKVLILTISTKSYKLMRPMGHTAHLRNISLQ